MPNGKLTPKQERFVREYLIDLNATQAAIRAKYSPKTAQEQSSRLLSNVMVSSEIARQLQGRSERTKIDADWVLKEYAEVWSAEITDILDEKWQLKTPDQWPRIWRRMTTLNEVKDLMERSKDGGKDSWDKIGDLIKLNCFPKAEALKKIGEHVAVKAFQVNNQTVNINVTLADDLQAGRERERQRLLASRSTEQTVN